MEVTEQPTAAFLGRQVMADGAILIRGVSIVFRVQRLKPGIVLLTVSGGRAKRAEDAAAERIMLEELDREIEANGGITVFADMRDSSTMAAQSREVASEWLRAHKQHIRASHILVRSKLIEMAMSVISMVVGGGLLHVYSRVPEFMQALHGAAPGLLDLPHIAHVAA
jgi:hypothetical protein